jgi:hypothetical protein
MAIPTVKYNRCKGKPLKLAMQNPVSRLAPVRNNKYPNMMSSNSRAEGWSSFYRGTDVRQNITIEINSIAWINQGASIKLIAKLKIATIAAKIPTISSFAMFDR